MTQLGVFRDDYYNAMAVLPQNQYTAYATAGNYTVPAASIAGAQEVYFNTSGPASAATYTTDTAANIIARIQNAVAAQLAAQGQAGIGVNGSPPPGVPNLFNVSWYLQFINTSGSQVTLAAGSGVTISGTATIAAATNREFLVTVTGPNSVTFQNVGSGTN